MKETSVVGADALFQQYTIKEIQEIERKLRNEIEKKKEDLRQMVGERYRDLIDAADTITDMKTSAESVTNHIKLIEGHCTRLQAATRPSGILSTSTCRDEQRRNDKVKLFEIAAELKVLMDMPTMLWSAVEGSNFLSAAQLFLLAQFIHSSLLLNSTQQFHGVPLLSKFPVIRHQTSLIGQFRTFISQKCRTSLKQDQLTNKELTNILCCILLLDDSNPTQLFEEFLNIRLGVVDAILKLNKEGTTSKHQVSEVVQLIVNTVQLVSSVFARTSEDDGEIGTECCSLFQILNSLLDKSHEGPISYLSDKISLSYAYLPSHIKDYRPTLKSKLEPISANILQKLMKQWIEKVKNVVHVSLRGLLQFNPSIKGLVLINEAVEKKLAEVELDAWKKDCHLILNQNLSVYDVFLKDAIIERVKVICNKHLENAFLNCQKNISKCLQRVFERHFEVEDEDVSRYVWLESQNYSNFQEVWSTSNQSLLSDGGMLGMKARRHTPQIQSLCKDFDESLRLLLDDLQSFGSGDQCSRNYDVELYELRKHLVELTRFRFSSFMKFIRDILIDEKFQTESYVSVWPPYVGRMCHAFVELCDHARLCLTLEDIHSKGISTGAKKDQVWQEVKAEILQLSDDAFRRWCSYLVCCFKRKLSFSLGDSSPADFLQNILQWEEVEIQEEMEDGKVIKSMIQVPIQASSFLQSSLFSTCQDFNHSTGHIMNKAVTREFNKEIVFNSLECYGEASAKLRTQASLGPRLVQMIALQLLFDVRFLNELLCPKDDSETHEKSDLIAGALEALIDPFDLDVFNPSLQLNLNCALQRSMLLFGLVISERSASVSSQRLGSQNQPPNLLPLTGSTSRFLLLPIASNKLDNVMSSSMNEDIVKSGKSIMSRSFGSSPNLGQTGGEGVTKSYSFYDRVTAMGSSWFGTGN